MKRIFLAIILAASAGLNLNAQGPRFALLADTHISGNGGSADDLRRCVRDINDNTKPDFVLCAGDLTNFGTDGELRLVKSILDSLSMPYYVVPGNHDAKWSESGCNSFVKTFGYEQFDFTADGWRFLGCASGPNMRMAPALIPRSDLVWLNSLEKDPDSKGCIFVNHYPLDSSVLNYFDVRRELRRAGVNMTMGGHWHKNTILDYGGIPGILGRSSLSSTKTPAGYNIACINGTRLEICERRLFGSSSVTLPAWYIRELKPLGPDSQTCDDNGLPEDYPWMRYDVNAKYPLVHEAWRIREDSDIAAGFAFDGKKRIFYACCDGTLKAVSTEGRMLWKKKLPGRIFSTPAYSDGIVTVGCADNGLYAFRASDGKQLWKCATDKSVLSSPAIVDGTVYFGDSDGKFRAVDLRSGRIRWTFGGVGGFVECKAYADREQVVFGAWNRTLYSLDPRDGSLQWTWKVDKNSEMYSPAACWPVKSRGHIYVAVPDRRVYVLDAESGREIYHIEGGREAVGISPDGNNIYVKTMHSEAYALDASAESAEAAQIWRRGTCLSYDISPTSPASDGRLVYIPSDKGNLIALDPADGMLVWAHKISVALVNPLLLTSDKKGRHIFASTMDGVVVRLDID